MTSINSPTCLRRIFDTCSNNSCVNKFLLHVSISSVSNIHHDRYRSGILIQISKFQNFKISISSTTF